VHVETAHPALFIMHFLLVVCFRLAPRQGATRLTSINLDGKKLNAFLPVLPNR
jgi:hypothetical protein